MSGAMARPGPARTRSESRQRTALVALRLLPNERDKLTEAARSRGITLSEFIRSSALQAVDIPAQARHPRSRLSRLPGRGAKCQLPHYRPRPHTFNQT